MRIPKQSHQKGKLDKTVETVLKQDEEEKQWELYCAVSANAFAEDVGSFEEFQRGLRKTGVRVEHNEPTLNNAQIQLQVEKADRILAGFVPPMKGGG